jgi:hypothetical protein
VKQLKIRREIIKVIDIKRENNGNEDGDFLLLNNILMHGLWWCEKYFTLNFKSCFLVIDTKI